MSVTANRAQHVITALSLALAAFLLLGQVLLFWQFHPHLPLKDTWHILPLVEQVLEYGWLSTELSGWLEPHAMAHRVVISRLLMTLDYQWFGGQNHLLFASAWLSCGWLVLQLTRALWASNRDGSRVLPTFQCALVMIFLLAPGQFFNLLNPINASWFTAMAFSVGALQLAQCGGISKIAAACLLGTLAAFSNFSGALVLLLIPAAVYLGHNPRPQVIVSALCCFAILALYQMGVQSGLGALLEYRLQHPDEFADSATVMVVKAMGSIALNTVMFLGSPLSSLHPLLAGAIVLVSLSFLAARLKKTFLHRAAASDTAVFFLLMACLCAGIALSAQLGRVLFDDADALRYQTIVMVYWLSIVGLVHAQCRPLHAQLLSLGLIATLVLLPLGRDASPEAGIINAGLRSETLARIGHPDVSRYRAALPLQVQDPLPVYSHFLDTRALAYAREPMLKGNAESGLLPRRRALQGGTQLSDEPVTGEQRPQLNVPATLFSVVFTRQLHWEAVTE